jgi:hypothetical protein
MPAPATYDVASVPGTVIELLATPCSARRSRGTCFRTVVGYELTGRAMQVVSRSAYRPAANVKGEPVSVILPSDGSSWIADMSWLLQEPTGVEQILEYEALLNQFFQGVRAAGMCQYDRHRLQAHFLDHALATHTSAYLDGHHKLNPFYRPPSIAMNRAAQPDEVAWRSASCGGVHSRRLLFFRGDDTPD